MSSTFVMRLFAPDALAAMIPLEAVLGGNWCSLAKAKGAPEGRWIIPLGTWTDTLVIPLSILPSLAATPEGMHPCTPPPEPCPATPMCTSPEESTRGFWGVHSVGCVLRGHWPDSHQANPPEYSINPIIRWYVVMDSTSHLIWYGTSGPGPLAAANCFHVPALLIMRVATPQALLLCSARAASSFWNLGCFLLVCPLKRHK